MLNLYLLSQDERYGYDTFDSCVVVAKSAKDAVQINPSWNHKWDTGWVSGVWATKPENVDCEYLGPLESSDYKEGKVVIASFNAG